MCMTGSQGPILMILQGIAIWDFRQQMALHHSRDSLRSRFRSLWSRAPNECSYRWSGYSWLGWRGHICRWHKYTIGSHDRKGAPTFYRLHRSELWLRFRAWVNCHDTLVGQSELTYDRRPVIGGAFADSSATWRWSF